MGRVEVFSQAANFAAFVYGTGEAYQYLDGLSRKV